MNLVRIYSVCVLFILCVVFSFRSKASESGNIEDSLKHVYKTATHGSLKSEVCYELANYYSLIPDYNKMKFYIKRGYFHASEAKDIGQMAAHFNQFGSILYTEGKYDEAKSFFLQVERAMLLSSDSNLIAEYYKNIGVIYSALNSEDSSLLFYEKSIEFDVNGLANAFLECAIHYTNNGKEEKALEYLEKGMVIQIKNNNIENQVENIRQIAHIYLSISDYPSAEEMLRKGIDLCIQLDKKDLLMLFYSDLANIKRLTFNYDEMFKYSRIVLKEPNKGTYHQKYAKPKILDFLIVFYSTDLIGKFPNKQDSILQYDNLFDYNELNRTILSSKSLEEKQLKCINLLIGDGESEFSSKFYTVVGMIRKAQYFASKSANKDAIVYLLQSYKMDEDLHLNLGAYISEELTNIYLKNANFKQAYAWRMKNIELNESVFGSDFKNKLGGFESKMDFVQQSLQDSLLQQKKEEFSSKSLRINSEAISVQNGYIFTLVIGIALLSLLIFFWYRKYKMTLEMNGVILRQRDEVTAQYTIIKSKTTEITESIHYAKIIQNGLLVNDENIVYSHTKEIVSGNFYWKHTTSERSIYVLFDSGLESVPGAFVTIIGRNIIRRILKDPLIDVNSFRQLFQSHMFEIVDRCKGLEQLDYKMSILFIEENEASFTGINQDLYLKQNNKTVCYSGQFDKSNLKTHFIPIQSNDIIYLITKGFCSNQKEVVEFFDNLKEYNMNPQLYNNQYKKYHSAINEDAKVIRISL